MPDLNPTPAPPPVRRPRGVVRIGGKVVEGWQSWEVDNNAYRSADTFRVVFALALLRQPYDADWFSRQESLEVEILAGFPADPDRPDPSELDSLILGHADELLFDPTRGTIELTGRDLTALLIDTQTSENFPDHTASQIATKLAERYQLTPVVTATKTKAGDYYRYEHAVTTQQQSEWELLTQLANVEDFVLYVKGRELHFEPRPAQQADHYAIDWAAASAERGHPVANACAVQFSRNLTIAKGVAVEVRSWNAEHKKAFKASWPKEVKAAQPGQSAARAQLYRYAIAGLTQDKALQRAQSIYRQIVAHEMHLTASLPADNVLDSGKTLLMRGTGTAFDQLYYPESVTRSMSIGDGYRMSIRAKNTAGPQAEAAP